MRKIRCIIAGCRTFDDLELMERTAIKIFNKRQYMPPDMEIISGNAAGADITGEKFAKAYGIPVKKFVPDWNAIGKRAGIVRNSEMAFYATQDGYTGVLLAYWDSKSKGTKHMIEAALTRGIEVYVIDFRSEQIHIYNKTTLEFEKL